MANYYRVLRGVHSEGTNEADEPRQYGPGQPNGDIVDSKTDLLKHNPRFGLPKFQKISDAEAAEILGLDKAGPEDDGLDDLSIADLRQIADAESPSVDLTGLTKKDEIIARIRQAEKGAPA